MLSCTSVRYVESRQRYSNDVNSYYFLQLHGGTHVTSNVYAQDYTNNNNSTLYQLANNGTLAKILSRNLVNYLNESASILQITSMMPVVSNVQYADKINSSLHGISDSDDVEKRQIADRILNMWILLGQLHIYFRMEICIWKNHTTGN
jgi:hypothetical protein